MKPEINTCHFGDCLETMKGWPDGFVNCAVTSPPYWGLRRYLDDDHPDKSFELGQESTPEEYVSKMVEVFREVRRVLKDDGTLWLNLGSSYASGGNGGGTEKQDSNRGTLALKPKKAPSGYKSKDLVPIPWLVAIALREDGWYLRSDIIWSKPNPMPSSVTDRPTMAHEYIFLMSKKAKYYYDSDAIKEPGVTFEDRPHGVVRDREYGYDSKQAVIQKRDKQRGHGRQHDGFNNRWDKMRREEQCSTMRNKRSVWTVSPHPYSEAHFATFPPELIKPCILAGCPASGLVLDPFLGSGTSGEVAQLLGRNWIGCELNREYEQMQKDRTAQLGMALRWLGSRIACADGRE